jgi:hypothetical protein
MVIVHYIPVPEFIDPVLGMKMIVFMKTSRKTLIFNPIRTQRCWYQLVLDEIRLGGSFQIRELRRGRDQQVFQFKERPY